MTAAPLKPQQRMNILCWNALPKLLHTLCLGIVHKKTLKHLDQLTHQYVRKWLRLPPDTPVAYFHAPISSGGLGVFHFASKIPQHRWKRTERLCGSDSGLLRWAVSTPYAATSIKLTKQTATIGKHRHVLSEDVKTAWEEELYTSVDGTRLRPVSQCPNSCSWMINNRRIFPRLYVRMTHLRCGLLTTKTRRARSNDSLTDVRCHGGCGKPESLRHVLQNCAITHENRCRRHNDVSKMLNELLLRSGSQTFYESRIPLPTKYCKPDVIAVKDGKASVLDVTICDPDLIQSAWERKMEKYNTDNVDEEIRGYLCGMGHEVSLVVHESVVITYNGLLYGRSGTNLRNSGLSPRDRTDLCICTMQGSLRTYDGYMKSTHTHQRFECISSHRGFPLPWWFCQASLANCCAINVSSSSRSPCLRQYTAQIPPIKTDEHQIPPDPQPETVASYTVCSYPDAIEASAEGCSDDDSQWTMADSPYG